MIARFFDVWDTTLRAGGGVARPLRYQFRAPLPVHGAVVDWGAFVEEEPQFLATISDVPTVSRIFRSRTIRSLLHAEEQRRRDCALLCVFDATEAQRTRTVVT